MADNFETGYIEHDGMPPEDYASYRDIDGPRVYGDGTDPHFDTMQFLPDRTVASAEVIATEESSNIEKLGTYKQSLAGLSEAIYGILGEYNEDFQRQYYIARNSNTEEGSIGKGHFGFQASDLITLGGMVDARHAREVHALWDHYGPDLRCAIDLERTVAEAINAETEQYRGELLARADWTALLDSYHAEPDDIGSRYYSPNLTAAISALSPLQELPEDYREADRLRQAMRDTQKFMHTHGHTLPEGTLWQAPDASWEPTPAFGEQALAWKKDLESVAEIVAHQRKQFLYSSPDFNKLSDLAWAACDAGMGMDNGSSGGDGLPAQLKYEVERHFSLAKEDLFVADTDFIEEYTSLPSGDIQIKGDQELARYLCIYSPKVWVGLQLKKVPEFMMKGLRSVRFASHTEARQWVYKGKVRTAAATYNSYDNEITLYANPNAADELMQKHGMTLAEAHDYIFESTKDSFAHEGMHHVHFWRATFDQLVRFKRTAACDGLKHVSPYVAEAYDPATELNGDKERFAETGMQYYRSPDALRDVGGGNHFKAFSEFAEQYIDV